MDERPGSFTIGVGIALFCIGVFCFISAAFSANSGGPADNNAPGVLMVMMMGFVISGVFVISHGSNTRYHAEVHRIISLGKRISATVMRVYTHTTTSGDGTYTSSHTTHHLEASWVDPLDSRTYVLKSQPIPAARADSYCSGDPVVVFIDPMAPEQCHFDIG